MKIVTVASVALIDQDKKILLAKRPEGKAMEGLWEFPGGKMEAGERPEETLKRELKEELGIVLCEACLLPANFVSYSYTQHPKPQAPDCGDCSVDNRFFVPASELGLKAEFHLIMLFYICYKWQGVPEPKEKQILKWYDFQALSTLEMPPADKPLLTTLASFI